MSKYLPILYGYYYADGHYCSKNRIKFSVGVPSYYLHDQWVKKELNFVRENYYNVYLKITNKFYDTKTYVYDTEDTEFQEWLIRSGLNISNKTKNWNGYIRFKNLEEILMFLIGYYIGDGDVTDESRGFSIRITTYSDKIYYNLIEEFKKMGYNDIGKYLEIYKIPKKQLFNIKIPQIFVYGFRDELKIILEGFQNKFNFDFGMYYKMDMLIRRVDFLSELSITNNLNNLKESVRQRVMKEKYKSNIVYILEHPLVKNDNKIKRVLQILEIDNRYITNLKNTLGIDNILTEKKLNDLIEWVNNGMVINAKIIEKMKSIYKKNYKKTREMLIKCKENIQEI